MMTKAWNGRRNVGKGISKLATARVRQLMDDGEERSCKEIIDALLSWPTNGSLKYTVPTKSELAFFLKLNHYARRKTYKTERLQNGMVFRYQEMRYRKE